MQNFIDIALSLPTVLFTVPMAFVALYWLLAMLGAVDIEILDGLDGAAEGLDAAADALDGAADAMVDGAAEGVEGAANGTGAFVALATALRLGHVPLTVSISAFVFWGWITGFMLTWLWLGWGADLVSHLVFSLIAMALTTGIALGLTNLSVRPMEPVFRSAPGRPRAEIVGEICEITTGRVDAGFGQATAQVGGDHMAFHVRCDRIGNGLARGHRALIVHYDARREAFVVEPLAAEASQAAAHRTRRSNPTQEG